MRWARLAVSALWMVAAGAQARAAAPKFGVHGGKLRARAGAEPLIDLPAGAAGWYLKLDVPVDHSSCAAELRDVSPGPGPLPKWMEKVYNATPSSLLTLEAPRYRATHTYRLTLRCGLREISHALVHLLAPSESHANQIDLARSAPAPEAETPPDELAPTPKGSL